MCQFFVFSIQKSNLQSCRSYIEAFCHFLGFAGFEVGSYFWLEISLKLIAQFFL
jgi:hypothetical protein